MYSVGRHDSHPGGHQEVAADEKWVSVSKQSGKEPRSPLCCSSPTGFPGGAHFRGALKKRHKNGTFIELICCFRFAYLTTKLWKGPYGLQKSCPGMNVVYVT